MTSEAPSQYHRAQWDQLRPLLLPRLSSISPSYNTASLISPASFSHTNLYLRVYFLGKWRERVDTASGPRKHTLKWNFWTWLSAGQLAMKTPSPVVGGTKSPCCAVLAQLLILLPVVRWNGTSAKKNAPVGVTSEESVKSMGKSSNHEDYDIGWRTGLVPCPRALSIL